ncbi:LOW QUALITY PROTEIN: muscle M-line assembly protein unc-89-like [Pipra filicauda]|uniref:LOW QUALITY PROTEIN: muscle M-line assembly protein unc-89-like n=1 Tax=Pipra filicauda TaxID=649802 RepID=A0A7R5KWI4_9PASS|nr:LOW QUALITY PROTEIN: muscle M-line assembly protein unc-89-like [Pipra filicauda]
MTCLSGKKMCKGMDRPNGKTRETQSSPNIWDKPWRLLNAGDPQIVPQEGSGSASSVGTEVAAEAARDLPSPAPAPEPEEQRDLEQTRNAEMQETVRAPESESPVSASHSPSEGSEALLDTKQSITWEIMRKVEPVIEGSSQELEEQRELEQTTATEMVPLLTAERTESPVPAPQSPPDSTQDLLDMVFCLFREIMRKAERVLSCWPEEQRVPEQSTATKMITIPAERTESPVPAPHSPSEGSKALLDTDQSITREILSEPELEIQGSGQELEEQRNLEQTMDTDTVTTVPAERTESPVPAPQSPCSPSSPSPSQVKAQALSEQEEGAGGDSVLAVQDTDEGPFPGEGIGWKYYADQDISQWGDEGDQELSQETSTHTKKCPGGDCTEQELSPGEVKSYQELSDWEEHSEEEEPQGEVKSYQDVSDWEENIKEEQSQGEESRGQVSDWEEYGEEELSHGAKSYQEVSDWEDYTPSWLSRWEDDSDRELALADGEHMSVPSLGSSPCSRRRTSGKN